MAEETTPGGGQDPGPIGTGPVENITVFDPGPIEIDSLMANVAPTEDDPAGRDLRLGEAAGHETRRA